MEAILKCCICNGKNVGEFITINGKKYHLDCIEKLAEEHRNNDILNEYESWLRIRLQEETKLEPQNSTLPYVTLNKKYYVFDECLHKLESLKEAAKISVEFLDKIYKVGSFYCSILSLREEATKHLPGKWEYVGTSMGINYFKRIE